MHPQTPSLTPSDIPVMSLMARLKNDTAPAHKQLEKASCFKRLFANDYQWDEYIRLLGFFYGYFGALEPLVFDGLPSELQHRCKTHLLRQDLTFLGIDVDTLPMCGALPELASFAQKMGTLYVLEGSMLGGRVISQHLLRHFGHDITPALYFYQCYGENLDQEWRNFVIYMTQTFDHQPESVINEVVEAANATFSALQQWVER